jgi:iron complex outermembrane recepter protein
VVNKSEWEDEVGESKLLRSILMAGLSVGAIMIATPAVAQQETAEDREEALREDDAREIVVTARRRAESLIDVPIAITAYSGEQLEQQGALDLTEIGDTTPNVTLEASRATNSTLTAFIRGVGQQDPVSGFEAGVGIYIDDVFLNRPQAALLDIYNVERIEVLRGPQGTLYGRNTIGGAIKYVTRRLPRDPELRVRANLGTHEQADLVATASAPVSNGILRVGASGARLSRGGFGKNLTTGEANYNRDVWAGRLSAEINNERDVFIRVQGDLTQDNSNPRGGHRLIPGFVTGLPVLPNEFDTRGALSDPEQNIRAWGLSLFAEVQPWERWTIRSITAHRDDRSATPIDFDAQPRIDLDVPGFYLNNQTSQEFQLLYNTDRFNAIFGAYFLDAGARTQFDVRIFTTFPGLTAFTDADIHTETYALFGDLTFDLTNQFSVSAGGRYTWDRRTADILRQNYLGGGSPLFGGAGVPFGLAQTDFQGERSFNRFTPRGSISFRPTRDHHLYASYSQGFKGGGFDPRGVGANAPDLDGDGIVDSGEVADFLGFEPEVVDSYELGYRGSIFGNRLNLAVTGFHADYNDVQIPGSAACTVGGIPTFCGVVTNAAKARFRGLEVEANARLANSIAAAGDSVRLSGTLGYIDAQFREYFTFIAGSGTVDVTDFRKVQNTPKWTASATLDYGAPVGAGRLNLINTVSYRSKTYQFEVPTPVFGFDQPGFALWDASIVWRANSDRWYVGLHGKNLTDKRYITSGYNFLLVDPLTGSPILDPQGGLQPALGADGILTAFYGNPRQVFLTIGLNFR